MKKFILLHIALLLIILASSCVTSLQPLTPTDKMITDDRIIGQWQDKDKSIRIERLINSQWYKNFTQNKINRETLSGHNDSAYIVNAYSIAFEEKGITYYMRAALTLINNSLYVDATPLAIYDPANTEEGSGLEWNFYYLPTVSMGRLDIVNQHTLTIVPANGDFVKDQIISKRAQIKHESDALSGTLLITASTNELRQFVQKYGHDERLFSSKNSFTLTRKG